MLALTLGDLGPDPRGDQPFLSFEKVNDIFGGAPSVATTRKLFDLLPLSDRRRIATTIVVGDAPSSEASAFERRVEQAALIGSLFLPEVYALAAAAYLIIPKPSFEHDGRIDDERFAALILAHKFVVPEAVGPILSILGGELVEGQTLDGKPGVVFRMNPRLRDGNGPMRLAAVLALARILLVVPDQIPKEMARGAALLLNSLALNDPAQEVRAAAARAVNNLGLVTGSGRPDRSTARSAMPWILVGGLVVAAGVLWGVSRARNRRQLVVPSPHGG